MGIPIHFRCDDLDIDFPGWIEDVSSFLRWCKSGGISEEARAWWLEGDIWVEVGAESDPAHRALKNVFHAVLGEFIQTGGSGRYYADRVLLSNSVVGFAGRPDGVFVHVAKKAQEHVCITKSDTSELVMMEGAPTLVLEVISRSSFEKDTKFLRRAYHQAGIYEYWLVDARHRPPSFDVLQPTRRGYRAARKRDGWVQSYTFIRSFKLSVEDDSQGRPKYNLEIR